MRNLIKTTATILRARLNHRRTDQPIDFEALIEFMGDSGYRVRYSHVPRASTGPGIWFSDSLTHAWTFDEALEHVDTQCSLLERAYEARAWSAG